MNYQTLRQALNIRTHLVHFLNKFSIPTAQRLPSSDCSKILKCLLDGFVRNVAHLQNDGSYKTIGGKQVWLDSSSVLHEKKTPWIMYSSGKPICYKTILTF